MEIDKLTWPNLSQDGKELDFILVVLICLICKEQPLKPGQECNELPKASYGDTVKAGWGIVCVGLEQHQLQLGSRISNYIVVVTERLFERLREKED